MHQLTEAQCSGAVNMDMPSSRPSPRPNSVNASQELRLALTSMRSCALGAPHAPRQARFARCILNSWAASTLSAGT
jgi:hypothetical protein